ncbi:MAG: PPE family protein, partial [Mycobacterium sp.]
MDFGALPPEINSARMYSGAGSAPMVAAASAWNGLAAELNSAATGYDKVITSLASEEWMGPASASMAAAAAPNVAWMITTAAQAEQTATQAQAAAAAYENAFAATVAPPLIAANRTQLAQLVSTNVLGQNTPAIAQLEAQYGQMWAQDAAAMYGYAGQSATAAKVTPFASPAQTTNPGGQATQAAAVTQAAATSSGTSTQSTLSLLSSLPTTLQGLATPISSASSTATTNPLGGIWQLLTGSSTTPTSINGFLSGVQPFLSAAYNTEGLPYFSTGMANTMLSISKALAPAKAAAAAAAAGGGLGGLGGLLGGGGGPVSAGLGNAASVGRLSVPPAWSGAGAALTPASTSPMPIST